MSFSADKIAASYISRISVTGFCGGVTVCPNVRLMATRRDAITALGSKLTRTRRRGGNNNNRPPPDCRHRYANNRANRIAAHPLTYACTSWRGTNGSPAEVTRSGLSH